MSKSTVINGATKSPVLDERAGNTATGDVAAVTLGIPQYIELLVRASVTDELYWPPSLRHGAKLLARIREIERECAEKHGKWDWEMISEELQDEYDGACGLLDRMQDTGERFTLEEVLAKYGMDAE